MQNFNPLDPMNHSMYLESLYPNTIDEAVAMYPEPTNPNGPKLKPQPTKDSWYYSQDGADDGHITPFEKVKAFVKGGTHNIIKGLFCDSNGFSWGRTLMSAAGIAAVALTGPIGMAVAGGLGLWSAIDNFNQSRKKAALAVTDQQAREAYEGYGESATTAGLSLFGGWKAFKALKNNFSFAKANPNLNIKTRTKLLKWDISKLFKKPSPTPVTPNNTPPVSSNNGTSVPSNNSTPVPQPNHTPIRPNTSGQPPFNANPVVINDNGYIPDWKPVGDIPKTTTHEYIPDWKPVGEIPKTTTHPYVSPYEPIDPALVKPQVQQPTTPTVAPEIVPDTAPIDPTLIKPSNAQPEFNYGTDNNHFFG